MVDAVKAWPFANGFSYIDRKGRRKWTKNKPNIVSDRKANKRKTTKTNSIRVGVSRMVTRRRRRTTSRPRTRRTRDKRAPLLPLLGLGAAMSKPIENVVNGDYMGAAAEASARFVGYNFQSKKFDAGYAFWNCWLPIGLGAIGSKLATKFGVNRAMKNVPFLGKYIKL